MNIREAILKAADHIETAPLSYNWYACEIPECGTPGCVLGWIGFFSGYASGRGIYEVNQSLGTSGSLDFYNRLSTACENAGVGSAPYHGKNRADIAKGLRAYADLYHPTDNLPPIEAKKSGADIAREIMSRPYNDKELANA